MSRRMEKVNELLQQELSQIIQKEFFKDKKEFLITVQGVIATKDLKTASVWVSIFGTKISEDQKKELIKQLQKKSFEFQKILSQRIDLKYIPRLRFKIDISGEAMQEIDEIIKRADKKH